MWSMPDKPAATRIVLVCGPSGAGRSSAIDALEDAGFETIDNLPLSLIPRLIEGPPLSRPIALGIDVRNRDFSVEGVIEMIDALTRAPEIEVDVLYIDCDLDTLVRRYSETRRRHPLSPGETPLEGLQKERALLQPIRARADTLIDTSQLNPHELRAEVRRWFQAGTPAGEMVVAVQSFSYKRGLPRGVDMVFDVRFLRNPHWQAELRPLDGRDPAVAVHVEGDARFAGFFAQVEALILSLLPAFAEEGKSTLTIAFGCTGGQHRSVAVAEKMSKALAQAGWRVSKRHRELERRSEAAPTQGKAVHEARVLK
jgi:UPF0042 nucleotide-binding protein